MFAKQYLLRTKSFLINGSTLFWMAAFPFILATLFHLAFGTAFKGGSSALTAIPVAVVNEDNQASQAFTSVLEELEDSGSLLKVTETDWESAQDLLRDEEVDGIITVGSTLKLTVTETGMHQTILKNFLDTYQRKAELFKDLAAENPQKLAVAAAELENSSQYLETADFGREDYDPMEQYFYALIAMSCLYTCFLGLSLSTDLQGNLSGLAARRCMAPTKKAVSIFCDFLAALTPAFLIQVALLLYMTTVLGINFGSHPLLLLATVLTGCILGLSLGTFLGCIVHAAFTAKTSICVSICLILSFLAGLMFNIIPYTVEKYVPLVNRINPAMLLANSFYCLNYYQNYGRFVQNLSTLILISLGLCIGSVLLLRRKRYASI